MPYAQTAARAISGRSKKRFVHVTCAHCAHAMLLAVTARKGGFVCAGVFTDCSFEDAQRFIFGEKISIDDVIDAHNALQFDNFLEIR